MKIGLREKFLGPTMLLILLGLATTSYVSYLNSRKMMVDTVNDQLRQNAESILDYISAWADNRKQDVILWSKQNSISQTLAMSGGSADMGSGIFVREVNEDLRKYAKAHPYYAEIGIASPTGSVLTNSLIDMSSADARLSGGGATAGKNIKDQDYFRQSMQGNEVMTNVRVSDETGKPVFVISAPVKQTDDGQTYKTIGILYGVVDLPYFTKQFVEPVKIGESGYIYIFDKDGTVIAHRDKDKILKENVKRTAIGEKMLSQQNGLSEYSADGRDWLVAFKTDKELGWTVVAVASMNEQMAPVRELAGFNFFMTIGILVLAVIVIIFVAAKVSKPINKITTSLFMVARQVSSASSQISGASQQLAQGASAQASSIEETSASLEELASMANHNSDNAQQANSLSKEATDAANNGAWAMDKLLKAMEGINESSSEVAQVAKGIEEIAFQTNLLALNAAVEAARAGEAGKGFAVVAEEVRNLAQRSSEQAKVTSTLITESGTRTREGSKQAAEANDVLKIIQESVAKVVGLVSEISAASKEQAQGIDQINKAVSTMDQIVQQNSASSEQSASASEELSAQAFQMKDLVRKLSEKVTGSADDIGDVDEQTVKRLLGQAGGAEAVSGAAPQLKPRGGGSPQAVEVKAEEIIPFDDDELTDF